MSFSITAEDIAPDVMGDQADHAAYLTDMATRMGIDEQPIVVTPNDEAVLHARFETMARFDISDEKEMVATISRLMVANPRFRQRYGIDHPIYAFYQEQLEANGWRRPLLRQ